MRLRSLLVLARVDSTNARLLQVRDLPAGRCDVCLAEYQTAGRGRHGRSWIAAPHAGLCLSIGWLFPQRPPQLSALALAAGVAAWRALRTLGIHGVRLKWPNDLIAGHGKLGGILAELRTDPALGVYVVLGIGLNMHLSGQDRRRISAGSLVHQRMPSLKPVALDELSSSGAPGRNATAARLIEEFVDMFMEFQERGFSSFVSEWRAVDALDGAPVRLMAGREMHIGTARGIDAEGALLLQTSAGLLRFPSAEVSLRNESGVTA